MRMTFLKSGAMLLGLAFLAFSSCKKEELDREKFLGAYTVTDICEPGTTYSMTVTESATAENTVVISNFANFNNNATATVSGSSITVPSQTFNYNDGSGTIIAITVSGSGTIVDLTMSLSYTFTATALGLAGTCSTTCAKQ